MTTVLLATLVASNALAQEDEETRRHGIFIESVDVTLINVEVFASLDGEPVTDLTIDDFEVLDDGQPAEISHFARVEQGRRIESDETTADELPEATNVEPPSREPSAIIVLVDQLFVSPTSRKQVFDALSERLGSLTEAGARVMVASQNYDLTIEQGFSNNQELIQSALDRLADTATPGYAAEIRSIVELWDITPDAAESRVTGPGQPAPLTDTTEIDAQSDYRDVLALSRRMHSDVNASLVTMRRFLDSLAGYPGRKALVYVADRLPVHPAEQLWTIWWDKYGIEFGSKLGVTAGGPIEFDLTLALEDLISDANANRVAFYPIGADTGVDFSSAASRGLSSPTLPSARVRESKSSDGLLWLSERTGGRAAVRSRAFEAFFEDLARDLATYYSLAYASPHSGDGKVHRLEIRVQRPGVELRHPTEYRDKSADQRMTDRLQSTITLGAKDNPLDIRVEVGKAKRKKEGDYTVPVEIRVPLANLVLLPGTTTHQGKFSIQLLARDGKGRFSDPVIIRMPLEVLHGNVSRALSQTVDYAAEMTLSGGSNTIAVGVHDDLGQTSSTVGIDIDTGS